MEQVARRQRSRVSGSGAGTLARAPSPAMVGGRSGGGGPRSGRMPRQSSEEGGGGSRAVAASDGSGNERGVAALAAAAGRGGPRRRTGTTQVCGYENLAGFLGHLPISALIMQGCRWPAGTECALWMSHSPSPDSRPYLPRSRAPPRRQQQGATGER